MATEAAQGLLMIKEHQFPYHVSSCGGPNGSTWISACCEASAINPNPPTGPPSFHPVSSPKLKATHHQQVIEKKDLPLVSYLLLYFVHVCHFVKAATTHQPAVWHRQDLEASDLKENLFLILLLICLQVP